jgi:transposase
MPKRHRDPYPPEFRRRIVDLVRAGRSPESLAKEFEPSAPAIRTWVRQAALDAGTRTDGVTSPEREELARLRREVKTLREEREILKKFAAWSVQESSRTPPKRSGS